MNTPEQNKSLAAHIEHTLLKPDSTLEQITKLCEEAIQYGFNSVCVAPYFVQHAKKTLKKNDINVVTVVGFPLGYNTVSSKVEETKKAINSGAHEIDMVINISALKSNDIATVQNDIQSVVTACHLQNKICKVIIETCYLNEDEIKLACKICADCEADYVKTSTGYGTEGMVLHKGRISEMATGEGEGKTLVSTLPSYLNALAGRGVHIVTVNDYLARRDCEWNAPLFEFHGLRVDCIDYHQPNSAARRNAYLADITYGTNNEFGFDYLRDNMASNLDELVQRKHHYAMVDEVDSVLIDDARTPLIISGPVPKGDDQQFYQLKPRIEKLVNAQKAYINTALTDAKKLIAAGNDKEGGFKLLQAYLHYPIHFLLFEPILY